MGEGVIEGWGSFVFKEKLRRLKRVIREWNKEVFGDLDQKVREIRDELNLLYMRDEGGDCRRWKPLGRASYTPYSQLEQ